MCVRASKNAQIGNRLSEEVISTLDQTIFGSTTKDGRGLEEYATKWFHEYIEYDPSHHGLLLQRQGGPCSLLAAVNGLALCKLMFNVSAYDMSNQVNMAYERNSQLLDLPRKSVSELHEALSSAISFSLWQAANTDPVSGQAVLVTADSKSDLYSTHYPSYVLLYNACLQSLTTHGGKMNVMLFVYSLLLSRGISQVKMDIGDDNKDELMIASHGNCSQVLLNLGLVGSAIPGVHDGLYPIQNDHSIELKGLVVQPVIGFLSIQEANGGVNVGSLYKNPKAPICVILGTFHSTLLILSDISGELIDPPQDIYLWDGIINQLTRFNVLSYDQEDARATEEAISLSTRSNQEIEDETLARIQGGSSVNNRYYKWSIGANVVIGKLLSVMKTKMSRAMAISFPDDDGLVPYFN